LVQELRSFAHCYQRYILKRSAFESLFTKIMKVAHSNMSIWFMVSGYFINE